MISRLVCIVGCGDHLRCSGSRPRPAGKMGHAQRQTHPKLMFAVCAARVARFERGSCFAPCIPFPAVAAELALEAK